MPGSTPTKKPAEIDDSMLSRVATELRKVEVTDNDVAIFLGEYMTEPKPTVFFDRPARSIALPRFLQLAEKRGLKLSRKTRMLYRGRHVFINGESFIASAADRRPLLKLADRRELEPVDLIGASVDVRETLHAWHEDGWISLR